MIPAGYCLWSALLSSHIFPFMCGMDLLYLVSLKKKVILLCSLVSLPRRRFFGGALRDLQKNGCEGDSERNASARENHPTRETAASSSGMARVG